MKVFGVGLFRTGTTTICEMFAKSFRADHEFRIEDELDVLVKRFARENSDNELRAFVRDRDAENPLDLDSSGAHFGLIDILSSEFPEAKFILTLRNVYSWLNSCVGKLYGDFVGGWKSRVGELANRLECLPDYSFVLNDRDGYKICIEQMMKTWTGVNRSIIHWVPPECLLIVNTETLSRSLDEIAAFCGIGGELLANCHSNPGLAVNYLSCFDANRLEVLVGRHCSALMSEQYPAYTLVSHMNREWSAAPPLCPSLLRYFSLEELHPMATGADAAG
jgi:Sulfotransferase domain